jgi:serine/threonine protein kinase
MDSLRRYNLPPNLNVSACWHQARSLRNRVRYRRGRNGEVYKARDGRLKRDVALKVLRDTFATDPERLARFEREAQVLASLNHSHIPHIHGLGRVRQRAGVRDGVGGR